MRKLASVQSVEALLPIDGADRIELAQIGGWRCVVKKGEFQVGQLGVYLEIDAVPPDTETWRWLWQSAKDTDPTPRPGNFRIKTKKLRGALSQGLLVPLSQACSDLAEVTEGDDLTEFLGVSKYEPPVVTGRGPNATSARRVSDFPTHLVPKTDEERVQSCKRALVDLAGHPWVATMKCDGMSATYLVDPERGFVACSRNYMVAVEDSNAWGRMALKYVLQEKLQGDLTHLAIQGEVVGPSIQGNPMGLADEQLRVFSVYDTSRRTFLSHREVAETCRRLDLPCVEVLFGGDAFYPSLVGLDFGDEEKREENGRRVTVVLEELLAMAEGKYPGTTNEREGLVIRPRDSEIYSPALRGRLSFKVISNRFLLKEKD